MHTLSVISLIGQRFIALTGCVRLCGATPNGQSLTASPKTRCHAQASRHSGTTYGG